VAFFLLAAAVIIAQLSIVGLVVTHDMFGSLSRQPLCKIFFNSVADAILLLSPCLIVRRKRTVAFVVVWLVAIWSFAQIVYFTNYRDLMPFSSFLLVKNISPTLVHSTVGTIGKKALLVLLMPLLLHAVHWLWLRKGEPLPKRRYWWLFVASLVAYVVLRLIITTGIYLSNRQNYSSLGDAFSTRYCHLGGRHRNYVMHNGAVAYAFYSLATAFHSQVSSDERAMAAAFIERECPHYSGNAHATAIASPNLIFIMVESLNAWAVNLDIDGRAVTPTLNALAADTASLVCLNMLSQAKNGRSSDGKFIYQTGLLPLLDKSVAMEYSDRVYPSITRALKERGYHAVEICGDEQGLWNVESMSRAYGFDTLYHHPELKRQLEQADFKSDKVVMDFAASCLPTLKGHFVAQLFTGVMHSPYTGSWQPATWISASRQFTPAVRNYLEKAHYFDEQLGIFLERLKQCGLYDSSVIVIASDHSEPVDDVPQGRPSLSSEGNECVLIVLNSGSGKRVQGPIGQVDVYPTLLDVMGLNSYHWKGLGHSVLRFGVQSAAFNTDEVSGSSPLLKQQQRAWTVSDIIIRANWFNSQQQ